MKPGFALSLSFEGISLLRRSAGGWRLVGEASLDSDDLAGDLAALRAQALELEPGGFGTKLILPNEQVRYLSVQTGGVGPEDRQAQVRAALDGATPYAVDDLVYDLSIEGETTHVAAVARETLAEAEAFAADHGFNPLSFVSVPGEMPFLGEPFFGTVQNLPAGTQVEADGIAVVVVGPAQAAPSPDVIAANLPEDDLEPEANAAQDVPLAQFSSRRGPAEAGAKTLQTDEVREPTPEEGAAPSGFVSRRRRRPPPLAEPPPVPEAPVPDADVIPAPAQLIAPPPEDDEAARLTVFGARETEAVGGKPRHLGLILTAALLVFLAAVAVWATFFLEDGLAGLFRSGSDAELAGQTDFEPSVALDNEGAVTVRAQPDITELEPEPEPESAPEIQSTIDVLPQPEEDGTSDFAAQDDIDTPDNPGLTDTDAAVLDALRNDATDPAEATQTEPQVEIIENVWADSPASPEVPALIPLDDLYLTSIDRTDLAQDAVALPLTDTFGTDLPLPTISSPVAAGTRIDLDPQGLVIPTAAGALNPNGVLVYLGPPPVVPPPTPTRFEEPVETDELQAQLPELRPRLRPSNLAELTERSQLGGFTRSELAQLRPRLRPENNKAEAEQNETPTAQAVAASQVPRLRPRALAQAAAAAQAAAGSQARTTAAAASTASTVIATAPTTTQVAAVAPRTVKPSIPSSASVARQATLDNAINLRRINLIGVYGTPSNRRALVRLPSGRYKKVKVGDKVDGGRISAIGDSELRYQKGGRNLVLKIPSG